jgi:hypothetical protein
VIKDLTVLVCGGRDYANNGKVVDTLCEIHGKERRILAIVQGGATGADKLASDWARLAEVIDIRVPAQWSTHGRGAGPKRNAFMLRQYKPDMVVAFPGGDGTADMIAKAVGDGLFGNERPDGVVILSRRGT